MITKINKLFHENKLKIKSSLKWHNNIDVYTYILVQL